MFLFNNKLYFPYFRCAAKICQDKFEGISLGASIIYFSNGAQCELWNCV